jgi:hypothetical protein
MEGTQSSAVAPPRPLDEHAGASFCPGCGAEQQLGRCVSCGATREAGGYRVERVLHESDHARVYLARDPSGAAVALKELIFARAPDAAALEAFEREASLLRGLSHPGVPRFVASFREGEGVGTRLYLAQEHVEGTSLADWIASHRFDEAEAARLCEAVLEILAYLHSRAPPLVHRDVKPANILLRADGSIALVDFGAAREVAPRGTYRATVAGTFGYMPPEALGGTLDRSADLYGLGATLVHLLSRRPPEELLWERDPAALADLLNVSAPFAAFLRKLVAPQRALRFSTAAEALAGLKAPAPAPASAPVDSRAPERPRQMPPLFAQPRERARWGTGWRRRRAFFVPLVVAVGMSFVIRQGAHRARRASVERVAPPSDDARRDTLGTLAISMEGSFSPIRLDGALIGHGSLEVPLSKKTGTLEIGRGSSPLVYRLQIEGGSLALHLAAFPNIVFVDGTEEGHEATFPVPPGGTAVFVRAPNGKKTKPITFRWVQPSNAR